MNGHTPQSEADFVGRWMQIAESARRQVREDMADRPMAEQLRACEVASIIVSMDNLMTFPFIAERVEAGKLALIGWYFDIQNGALYDFDQGSNDFNLLVMAPE
jgi:carbonic anhydrase